MSTWLSSEVALLSVEYLFRHTWGWETRDGRACWLTEDEIAHGRQDATGEERYDAGIGYSTRAVHDGLRKYPPYIQTLIDTPKTLPSSDTHALCAPCTDNAKTGDNAEVALPEDIQRALAQIGFHRTRKALREVQIMYIADPVYVQQWLQHLAHTRAGDPRAAGFFQQVMLRARRLAEQAESRGAPIALNVMVPAWCWIAVGSAWYGVQCGSRGAGEAMGMILAVKSGLEIHPLADIIVLL